MNHRNSNAQEVRPEDIVERFFSGSKEELLKVLVGEEGKESQLENFVSELKGLSFTKVRRYYEQFLNIYDEVMGKVLEGKIQKGSPLPDEFLVKLYLLKSHVVYDQAREGKKKKDSFDRFKRFVSSLILKIDTCEDLERAKHLFEAFVGYAKQ